jgi:3',5'-cyclic-AMP phosphodiesterase
MPLSRREALKTTLAGSLALLAGRRVLGQQPPGGSAPAKPFNVAHLTDLHIQPERRAREGVIASLHHAQEQKPDLILTGGDLVFDSLEVGEARASSLWQLFTSVMKNECSTPIEHALGNHDHWGWNKTTSKTSGQEPLWGHRRALEALGLEKPYRAFGRAGWRFVILNSTHPDPKNADGYIGRLDDEQFAWLESELKAASEPVLILSHIPILSAPCEIYFKEPVSLKRDLSNSLMHTDAKRLVDLFAKHPRVKLCLSGHVHEVDRIDYQGVSYLCNGAVSGNWWKGRRKMCDEGYGRLELFPDGTFTNRYVTYGWTAQP